MPDAVPDDVAVFAEPFAAGLHVLESAAPDHVASVRRHIFDHLDDEPDLDHVDRVVRAQGTRVDLGTIDDEGRLHLTGRLREGATATDLVLRVTEMLRAHGVVGKFVEFFGDGLQSLPLADRATIANMAPEYGATCGIFPVDEESLRYLSLSGRSDEQVALVGDYMKAQGMFHTADTPDAEYSALLELDMSTVVPSLAGPKRPQDRVLLTDMTSNYAENSAPMIAMNARNMREAGPKRRSRNSGSVEMRLLK